MRLLKAYGRLLKNPVVEELIDLVLFRPLALVVVQIVKPFPVTPNQISLSAILTGLSAGICLAIGTRESFIYGGIFYGITRVLDCSDGALARIKQNGTSVGRIIDGMSDYTNAFFVFSGLLIGLLKGGFALPVSPYLLVIPSAFCMALHSITIDYYRIEFMSHGLGMANSPSKERRLFSDELEKLNKVKNHRLDKFLIRWYLRYLKTQLKKTVVGKQYDRDSYYQTNKFLMPFWSLLGSSAYIFMIMLSSVIGRPMVFFYFSLVFANLWLCIMLWLQIRTNRSLLK